jgi:amino acid transporter
MFKKLITIAVIIYITLLGAPFIFAQRGIDPTLKPINAPGMPLTGVDENECTNPQPDENGYTRQAGTWDKNSQMCSTETESPVTAYLQIFAGALVMLSGGIAVIVVAVGGILYITAHGNQPQIEKAKNTLVFGVMGMLIIIFSYFIVRFVLSFVTGNA